MTKGLRQFRVTLISKKERLAFMMGNQCLDSLGAAAPNTPVGVYQCHDVGGNQACFSQYLMSSWLGASYNLLSLSTILGASRE